MSQLDHIAEASLSRLLAYGLPLALALIATGIYLMRNP